MTVTIIFAYALIILIICVSIVFSEFRRYLLRTATVLANLTIYPVNYIYRGFRQGIRSGLVETVSAVSHGTTLAKNYRWWLVGTGVLIALPIILLVLLRQEINIGSFADSNRGGDAVIASLLAGERLVPPPALPPESFTTAEVLAERPALGSASRDWNLLDASFEQRLLHVFQRMRDLGYEMVLLEGYRSPERQNSLAAMGNNVTNAKAFQSYHQFGLAADSAFLREGKIVISERDPWAMRGYQLYGQEAEAMGLVWGGRWKMMDFGHVELRAPRNLPKQ